jgi:adenine-specific DNA glycosylase
MDSVTWKDYFVEELLKWHRTNKRKFPWRKESDPYKILISDMSILFLEG